jgi:hypothetical protein
LEVQYERMPHIGVVLMAFYAVYALNTKREPALNVQVRFLSKGLSAGIPHTDNGIATMQIGILIQKMARQTIEKM